MLTAVSEELLDVPLYYTLPDLCSALHCASPKWPVRRRAHARGFASQHHREPDAIKTDAPPRVLWDVFRCWVKKHPVSEKRLAEPRSAAAKILATAPVLEANFATTAAMRAKATKARRWAPNPEEHWGPKAAARGRKQPKRGVRPDDNATFLDGDAEEAPEERAAAGSWSRSLLSPLGLHGDLTTYAVGGAEGRRRYGGAYKSAAELVAVHLRGAAARECDMWHDDASFVVKHVAFTLSMEESLRSIDGSVAVPYWDYTADAALDDWTSARLFDDDALAGVGDRADHAIASGRFAHPGRQSRGAPRRRRQRLRAPAVPWNVNPTPYVGRYRNVLGLEDGGYALPQRRRSPRGGPRRCSPRLTSLLNGMLHGEAHVMLGGHWGLDVDFDVQSSTSRTVESAVPAAGRAKRRTIRSSRSVMMISKR
ncbi:N(2),N(2)-dimethylguanosine tRNA methyltransferase [Aureococcus anophagefferens]|nr:N(2),N(2)-dimethylguanosine tRNA methyltransferase [Aureococcus anophagefferens]